MDIATSSDAFFEDYTVEDLYIGPDFDYSVGAQNVYSADTDFLLENNENLPLKNIVVFDGTFNGDSVSVVFPYSEITSLCVIDGQLVNIGADTVTGRMLYENDSIDPQVYDYYTYTLNDVYGSSSSVYNYGSFNYQRHYYLDNSGYRPSIQYDDTYGSFQVTDEHIYARSDDTLFFGILLLFSFCIIMGGFNRLWNRK